jgi:hypothetical protein
MNMSCVCEGERKKEVRKRRGKVRVRMREIE